jgi:opacity protein-like surface antigen
MNALARISALALLLAAPAQAERLVIEPGSGWNRGGEIRHYIQKRDGVDAVEIRGRCLSACAVFLSHNNVCVDRKARIGFHALSYRGDIASAAVQQDFTNYLGSAALGQWFLAKPARDRKRIVYLSGHVVIDAFGFAECDGGRS